MSPFQFKLLGTSHVAEESVYKIDAAIQEFNPDIICVELDSNRLHSLQTNETRKTSPKAIFQIGLWGYLFALFAQKAQKHIGKKLNILPGTDMLTAVQRAQEKNIRFTLIDQDVRITLRRFSQTIKFRDRWNLFKDILEGIVMPKRAMKKMFKITGNLDLKKIPSDEVVINMIKHMKHRYPGMHKALVHERNVFMVDRIIALFKKEPLKKILIVVGAGHKEEMEKLLNQKISKLEYIA
jgi:pheromone shutdown protein TraB